MEDDRQVKNENKFYAMIDRTRYIQRWALMRNNQSENVSEHSLQTAIFAHALAILRKEYYPQLLQVDPNFVLAKALFHDVSEVITGDLPTPVKYHDDALKKSYKRLENLAVYDLLHMLPENLRSYYSNLLVEEEFDESNKNSEEYVVFSLVKAADKLSAYVKCILEYSQGNNEFKEALVSTEKKIIEMYEDLPELKIFVDQYIPAFYLSLDNLKSKKFDSFAEELDLKE